MPNNKNTENSSEYLEFNVQFCTKSNSPLCNVKNPSNYIQILRAKTKDLQKSTSRYSQKPQYPLWLQITFSSSQQDEFYLKKMLK